MKSKKKFVLFLALGYTHKTVNHRWHFVDPQGIHTNTIENMWGQFKGKLRRMQGCRRTLTPSLTTHKLLNILLFCSCGGAEVKEN